MAQSRGSVRSPADRARSRRTPQFERLCPNRISVYAAVHGRALVTATAAAAAVAVTVASVARYGTNG